MTLNEIIKARVDSFQHDFRKYLIAGGYPEKEGLEKAMTDFLIASMQQVADAAVGEVPLRDEICESEECKISIYPICRNAQGSNAIRSRLLRWAGKG